MEHRWGKRVPVGIDVRLSCWPHAIGPGRMTNVSASGAFIETDLKLPPVARVHVEITLRRRTGTETQRIAAWVVRSDWQGFGLEWSELAPAAIREILTVAARPAASVEPQVEPGRSVRIA